LGILPVDLGTLLVIAPIIVSVVVMFLAFADLMATIVVVALLHGVRPCGPAFVGKVMHLARVALS
jgi:hypothetical protein